MGNEIQEVSVKNKLDSLFFTSEPTLTLAICAGASQIALMADEKLHTQLSHRPVA